MHDSCFIHPQSSLLRGIGWQFSHRHDLWCFSRHPHHSPIHLLPINVLCHHNQSYPSVSEERAACWVGFGEHVGEDLTHEPLDDDTKKILYRSAVRPSDSAHPNKRLVPDGGESSQTPKPIVFVRSQQDDSQSATKPMAEYNPDNLIGRTFLLPKKEQGERLRATIKIKVIKTSKLLDDQHDNAIDKINFHLDVGQGRAEAIMSYVHILDHLDHQEQHEDLYKFRAITGHQGPLSPQDENYKGSKYNVMVEWETGEITEEPLSLIAADDPVTCAEYAKKHDLLHLDGWKITEKHPSQRGE